MTKQEIETRLQAGVVKLTFKRVSDGTDKIVERATLKEGVAPPKKAESVAHTPAQVEANKDNVFYWDVVDARYGKFKLGNLISIE